MSKPIDQERELFAREDRYIVIKRKDLANVTVGLRNRLRNLLDDLHELLPAREYLVIESDWPEHQAAWRMIEARMSGSLKGEKQQFEDWYRQEYRVPNSVPIKWEYEHIESMLAGWQARAALQPAGGAVPDGWKLVPVKPTDHMTWVGQSMRPDTEISIGSIYAGMLAAAPHPVSG
ncbi:hypothetical protein M1D96_06305 [Pseudomonas sp. D1-3]